jgi:CHAT domain-containing protein
VGDQASEALAKLLVPTASLLHFATHGIASPSDPMDGSFLQFADGNDDGHLTAREIQGLPLRARPEWRGSPALGASFTVFGTTW